MILFLTLRTRQRLERLLLMFIKSINRYKYLLNVDEWQETFVIEVARRQQNSGEVVNCPKTPHKFQI